ncbi:MAG: hypothetical protein FJX76_13705 [Armatimonadetes bacterium]|nr:hypothetical protein [Armatimonadota bacterium]
MVTASGATPLPCFRALLAMAMLASLFLPGTTVAAVGRTPNAAFQLEAEGVGDLIRLRWRWQGEPRNFDGCVVYRSTTPLDLPELDVVADPVARISVRLESGSHTDALVADGVRYFYQLKLFHGKQGVYSNIVTAATAPRSLQSAQAPVIRVDKRHYLLEVAERDGTLLKRFPIALGRNPVRRKLHQDNASTPEGVYHIIGRQARATYYRAYDIDYPNAADRARYDRARKRHQLPLPIPDIGGEIQIHGRGINSNWTFGCMALRNQDMDELFGCPAITTGIPVLIFGQELSRERVEALWRKSGTQ